MRRTRMIRCRILGLLGLGVGVLLTSARVRQAAAFSSARFTPRFGLDRAA